MKTIDDRGQPIRLERLDRALLRMRSPFVRMSDPQRARLQTVNRWNLLAPAAWVVLAIAASFLKGPVPRITISCGFTFALFATLIVILVPIFRRQVRIDAIHHLPACGHCPACGHSLQGLSSEADGCTVCPECGAAWRVPDEL